MFEFLRGHQNGVKTLGRNFSSLNGNTINPGSYCPLVQHNRILKMSGYSKSQASVNGITITLVNTEGYFDNTSHLCHSKQQSIIHRSGQRKNGPGKQPMAEESIIWGILAASQFAEQDCVQ